MRGVFAGTMPTPHSCGDAGAFGWTQRTDAIVAAVVIATTAGPAGLIARHIIFSGNGNYIEGIEQLATSLTGTTPGTTVQIELWPPGPRITPSAPIGRKSGRRQADPPTADTECSAEGTSHPRPRTRSRQGTFRQESSRDTAEVVSRNRGCNGLTLPPLPRRRPLSRCSACGGLDRRARTRGLGVRRLPASAGRARCVH